MLGWIILSAVLYFFIPGLVIGNAVADGEFKTEFWTTSYDKFIFFIMIFFGTPVTLVYVIGSGIAILFKWCIKKCGYKFPKRKKEIIAELQEENRSLKRTVEYHKRATEQTQRAFDAYKIATHKKLENKDQRAKRLEKQIKKLQKNDPEEIMRREIYGKETKI